MKANAARERRAEVDWGRSDLILGYDTVTNRPTTFLLSHAPTKCDLDFIAKPVVTERMIVEQRLPNLVNIGRGYLVREQLTIGELPPFGATPNCP